MTLLICDSCTWKNNIVRCQLNNTKVDQCVNYTKEKCDECKKNTCICISKDVKNY